MSGIALIWAANVKGLKPATKIVLIQLADFHNKETGQCNPSAKRLADECKMGRATLFRHMKTLEEFGLVTRHARGDCDGGRSSNQYQLHLDISLGPSSRPNGQVKSKHSVSSQIEMGSNVSRNRRNSPDNETRVVSNRDPNLTTEPIKEPSTRKREMAADGVADEILHAYPSDRLRNRADSLKQIRGVLDEGISSEHLALAVKAYANETAGFTRSKVCFSDNWFAAERWRRYVEDVASTQSQSRLTEAKALQRAAEWITERHSMRRHITRQQVDAMLAAGIVSQEQIQKAGLSQCS